MRFFILGIFFFTQILCAKELDISVKSPSVLLINADTGAILFQKNADQVRYPASLTKIASALYVIEKLGPRIEYEFCSPSLDALVVVKKNAPKKPYHLEPDAILIGLQHKEEIPVMDLLHAHLIRSANDASNALAEAVSGSIPVFVKEMNEFLREKGCKSTHFVNPSGWHHPDHKTTALDLALLAKLVLENPVLSKIIQTPDYVLHQTNKNPARKITQNNKLIVKEHKHYYPLATGMKTGYHIPAGFNVIATASNGVRNLIAIVLGSSSVDERFQDVKKLFDTAFAEKEVQRTLFSAEGEVFQFRDEKKKIFFRAKLAEDVTHSYFPSEQVGYDAKISWMFTTPIKKGQKVGVLRVSDHRGKELFANEVISMDEVPLSFRDLFENPWVRWGGVGIILLSILLAIFLYLRKRVSTTVS